MKRNFVFMMGCMLLLTACNGAGPDSGSHTAKQTIQSSESAEGMIMIGGAEVIEGTEVTEGAEESRPADTIQSRPDDQAVVEPESAYGQNDSADRDNGYNLVREQLERSWQSSSLEEVEDLLSHRALPYESGRNVSGERVDMTWEDGTKLIFLDVTDDMGNPMGTQLMMMDGQLNDGGFQENYLNQYDVTIGDEYYPQTKERPLEAMELKGMNQTDLSIARNEIFARHGRKFEDPFLQAVFARKTWYAPQYEGEEFTGLQEGLLNSYEKENLKQIIAYEKKMGYRK